MDKRLIDTIEKIKTLSSQNAEFDAAMRELFGKTDSASSVLMDNSVVDDVSAIREALEIRANKSISYDFVKQQRLRDQLIIDNLRMENASLNLQQSEKERFYVFCINAFYQLENITNYYFHTKYPDIEKLLGIIESYTESEISEFYQFKRNGKERNVGDIPIAHKINAICNILFPGDPFKVTLGTMRQVRNEGEHRCMVILEEKDESNYLYKFFKLNSFNSIRINLIKIVNAIKDNIKKPIVPHLSEKTAIITQKLPSVCFVKIDNLIRELPSRLTSKISNKQVGDETIVVLKDGIIFDIKNT